MDDFETSANPSVIRSDAVYPLDAFKKRCRIGEKKLREYIARGLPVRGEGKTRFVVGSEFLEFVKKLPAPEPAAAKA